MKSAEGLSLPTIAGCLSLFIWSLAGVFVASLSRIPTYEILAIAHGISTIASVIYIAKKRSWHKLKQPLAVIPLGIVGVFGGDYFYISAYKIAPPAHVDIIYYFWPIICLFLLSVVLREKFKLRYLTACLTCLMAVFILISDGKGIGGIDLRYLEGYSFAWLDAFACAIFTVSLRYYRDVPQEMIGVYCACAFLISVFKHFTGEVTVMPTHYEWGVLFVMGISSQFLAYYLWDYGVKAGSVPLITVMSYSNAFLSMAFLVLFGFSEYSPVLLASSVLLVVGIFMAYLDVNVVKWVKRFVPTPPQSLEAISAS